MIEFVERRNSSCVKWDGIIKLYGEDILPLWVADMDFKTCTAIIETSKRRAEHGVFGYTYRDDEYYNSIIHWYSKRYGVEIKKDWIVNGPGIVPMIGLLINAITNPGDKIIIQPPVYPPFFTIPSLNGRIVVENRLKKTPHTYFMDFEDLERKIDEKTKMIILSNPHNPVGRVWTKDELEILVDIAKRNNLILISDEIHADLIYPNHKFHSALNFNYENIIVLNSPGKTFNLAGLTNSYGIIRNKFLRNTYISILHRLELGIGNVFGLEALKSAYNECEEWYFKLLDTLKNSRDFAVHFIKTKMPLLECFTPEATYLLWIDCSKTELENPQKFFLEKAKVFLNDGKDFGDSKFVRLNFATSIEFLKEALERMKNAYDSQIEFLVLDTTANNYQACVDIRRKVFIEEQNISEELEIDGKDPEAIHFLLKHFSQPIATARAREIENGVYKIERVAVLKEFRTYGYGKLIMEKIEQALKTKGVKELVLNSQLYVSKFYEKLGYKSISDIFQEAEIEHIKMKKHLE